MQSLQQDSVSKRSSQLLVDEKIDENRNNYDLQEAMVEYFNVDAASANKDRQSLEDFLDLPIINAQQGRFHQRKGRVASKKKSINIQQENKMNIYQAEQMKKQSVEIQIKDLKKQQKRERQIFNAVYENFIQKENLQLQELPLNQIDQNFVQLKQQDSNKNNQDTISAASSKFIENSVDDPYKSKQQNNYINDNDQIEQKQYEKVEDLRNLKLDNIQHDAPLLTKKKHLPPKSAKSVKTMTQDNEQAANSNIDNQYNYSYQYTINKISQIYNIPISGVNNNQGLQKNKKKNQLLIKMTPADINSRPNSSGNISTLNTSEIQVKNNKNMNNLSQKSPAYQQKAQEPLKIVRKIPGSSSSNSIQVNGKKNVLHSFFSKNQINAQKIVHDTQQSSINSNRQQPTSHGSLIKLLQKDQYTTNYLSIDSPTKQQHQQQLFNSKAKQNANQKNILTTFNKADLKINNVHPIDSEFNKNANNLQDHQKYNSAQTNDILFTNIQQNSDDIPKIKFTSKNNFDESINGEEHFQQIEEIESNPTSITNLQQIANNKGNSNSSSNNNNNNINNNDNQNNFSKKKDDDKSLQNKIYQFYGTIREDENEDLDQTPMHGNNIFAKINKKKREELDKQIEEEIFEESQQILNMNLDIESSNQAITPLNSSALNSSNQIKNQQNIFIRPVKSKFQRSSPVTSPKRSKRGKSVNSDNNTDQSFSAQNGVFEESMSMDSSMSSEFQFQGGIVNCLQHNPQKEQTPVRLSQNILDDLELIEENNTETEDIKQSSLTKDNLQKLIQHQQLTDSQINKAQKQQQKEENKHEREYDKMNQQEKIAEINKIQKDKELEKKKFEEEEKQKLFLQQMELERQRQMHKECYQKLQKEKQLLIMDKIDYEKLRVQIQNTHHYKSKEEEQQYYKYHQYQLTRLKQIENQINIKQKNLYDLEAQLSYIDLTENNIFKEIQFICNVIGYDINKLNLPSQIKSYINLDEEGSTPKTPQVFQKKPSFIKPYDKNNTSERIVSPKQKFIINSNSQIEQSSSALPVSLQQKPKVSSDILKEGWLYKKSPSIFKGWKMRYFVLTTSKICYYKEAQKKRIRGCVNFKIADAQIKDIDGDRFSIEIEGYKRKFELKSNSKLQSQEWVNLINLVIEENSEIKKPIIQTMKMGQYFKNDLITEHEFLEHIESGDILLFETNNIAAKFQRKITGSKYDHVALCVKMQDEIRIFDSTSDDGVSLTEWKEYIFINDLYEKVTVRKLMNVDRQYIEENLYTFILENIGKSYSFNFKKLISYCPKSNRDALGREKDPQEYFCSELVAKFLKNVDLLPQDKAASSYWPISFSQQKNLQLLLGASLGDEVTIILDKHRNKMKEKKKEIRSVSSIGKNN
ncbi:hypothetical protein ABPG74_011154 [Tetrahymena malaccensis]